MPHLASITYGPFDQMQSADLGGGGDAYYQYDASGQRVRKLIDTGANLIKEGKSPDKQRKTLIFVNNRLEGNALNTIAAMVEGSS